MGKGDLGNLNGLPTSILIRTSLQDLMTMTGTASTGGGAVVPIKDVVRMAAENNATNYLGVFDDATGVSVAFQSAIPKLAASVATMGFGASAGMEGASKWLGGSISSLIQRQLNRFSFLRALHGRVETTMLAGAAHLFSGLPGGEEAAFTALQAEVAALDTGEGLPVALTHPDFVLANVVATIPALQAARTRAVVLLHAE